MDSNDKASEQDPLVDEFTEETGATWRLSTGDNHPQSVTHLDARQHSEESRPSTKELRAAVDKLQHKYDDLQKDLREHQQEAEFFRRAAEAGNIGFWDLNLETGEFRISAEIVRLMNLAAASPSDDGGSGQYVIPREQWLASVHPKDRQALENQLAKASETLPFEREFRVRRPDGSTRWLCLQAKIARDKAGARRLYGAAIDITNRKRAEIALRETKDAAEAILDAAWHPMLVLDPQFRVLKINQSFCNAFGVCSEEALGVPVFEIGHRQWNIPQVRELLTRVGGQISSVESVEVDHCFERLGRRNLLVSGRQIEPAGLILLSVEDHTPLRASQRREQALLALHESLRATSEPFEMMQAAVNQLGKTLHLSRAAYVEIDVDDDTAVTIAQFEDGVPKLDGAYVLSSYGPVVDRLRRNETVVVRDATADPETASRADVFRETASLAFVCVPRTRDGELIAVLAVCQSEPRDWSDEDILLAEKFASRTWAAVEVTRAEKRLKQLNASLEKQVAERIRTFHVLRDVAVAANEAKTVEGAMRAALQRICKYNNWPLGLAHEVTDEGAPLRLTCTWHGRDDWDAAVLGRFLQRCAQLGQHEQPSLPHEALTSAQPAWLEDIQQLDEFRRAEAQTLGLQSAIAFPVQSDGEVVAVLEFFSSAVIQREERFMEAMPNIGMQLGHVVVRKRLERAIDRATSDQQRQISQELHDGVGQELTGLKYIVQNLIGHLQGGELDPQRALAERLAAGLADVHKQVRGLVRGLFPVDVDEAGLANAFCELAQSTADFYQLRCECHCDSDIKVQDNLAATQMYRIAQEAINNAIKHSGANRIDIYLFRADNGVSLRVSDTGRGLPPSHVEGMGIRIMRHRASLIGATFQIESLPDQGVTVTCTLQESRAT